ncbi:coiled-coil domain-containing protein 50-like isoform X1 [Arapaima gigas]
MWKLLLGGFGAQTDGPAAQKVLGEAPLLLLLFSSSSPPPLLLLLSPHDPSRLPYAAAFGVCLRRSGQGTSRSRGVSAMAEGCVDQKNLPGVKEACRDFAVLEDRSLAHSLQEQEIESHLASNVHRSRLVQRDIQVARRLQEEEDLQARARARHLHREMEQSDSEVAHEIQEQLVRQAQWLQLQEEKDEVIARKLQEKELKDSRKKRSKKQAVAFKETCQEEGGGFQSHRNPRSLEACSLGYEPPFPDSIRHRGSKPTLAEAERGRLGFNRVGGGDSTRPWDSPDSKMVVQKKEKPARPPPPRVGWDGEKEMGKDGGREGEQDRVADGEPQQDATPDDVESGGGQAQVMWTSGSQSQERPAGGQESSPGLEERRREPLNPLENMQEDKPPPRPALGPDWSRRAPRSMEDITKGVAHLDMQDQELRNLEVARRLQEEELKASQMDKRAAQVAQDEEIAWLIMQEERKKFKKSSNWDKRRLEESLKQLGQEEVAGSRSSGDGEMNRTCSQKPARPPPPSHDYENAGSGCPPSRPPCPPQASKRPETAQSSISFRRR